MAQASHRRERQTHRFAHRLHRQSEVPNVSDGKELWPMLRGLHFGFLECSSAVCVNPERCAYYCFLTVVQRQASHHPHHHPTNWIVCHRPATHSVAYLCRPHWWIVFANESNSIVTFRLAVDDVRPLVRFCKWIQHIQNGFVFSAHTINQKLRNTHIEPLNDASDKFLLSCCNSLANCFNLKRTAAEILEYSDDSLGSRFRTTICDCTSRLKRSHASYSVILIGRSIIEF